MCCSNYLIQFVESCLHHDTGLGFKSQMHGFAKGATEMPKKFDTMDQSTEEKVQSPEDRQAPGYDNEVPVNSWLRGGREDCDPMPATTNPKNSSTSRRGNNPWPPMTIIHISQSNSSAARCLQSANLSRSGGSQGQQRLQLCRYGCRATGRHRSQKTKHRRAAFAIRPKSAGSPSQWN